MWSLNCCIWNKRICIGFLNTSHIDSLYRFIWSVVDEVKSDICILQKGFDTKENIIKIKYANNFVQKLGMGDPTTCVYRFIYGEKDKNDTYITQYFIMNGLGLCIKVDSYVAHLFYEWSFSHNTEVPIAKKKNKYFLCNGSVYLCTQTEE